MLGLLALSGEPPVDVLSGQVLQRPRGEGRDDVLVHQAACRVAIVFGAGPTRWSSQSLTTSGADCRKKDPGCSGSVASRSTRSIEIAEPSSRLGALAAVPGAVLADRGWFCQQNQGQVCADGRAGSLAVDSVGSTLIRSLRTESIVLLTKSRMAREERGDRAGL